MDLRRLLLTLAASGCREPPSPPHPDVLLVVLDTVRADRLHCYGNPRPTSPQTDEVARAGVLFEDVTAPASWTYPSHASLFTGTPPWVHGARENPDSPEDGDKGWMVTSLRDDLPTLAERFAGAGYRTVLLSANGWLASELGLARGFADARVLPDDASVVRAVADVLSKPGPLFLFLNLKAAHAPWVAAPADWLAARTGDLDPATAPAWARPYLTEDPRGLDLYRPGADGRSGFHSFLRGDLAVPPDGLSLVTDLYDGNLLTVDYLLNQALGAWNARSPDGIVAVTSDHGEYLGEHGLIEHGGTVYSQVVRVPLVIAAPGRLPSGLRVASPVALTDVGDALRHLAGLDAPKPPLVDAIDGKRRDGPIQAAAWAQPGTARDVGGRYARDWTLFRMGSEALVRSSSGEAELYDLAGDPDMLRDLAAERPERVAALGSLAVDAFPLTATSPVARPSDDVRLRLEALGYAGAER